MNRWIIGERFCFDLRRGACCARTGAQTEESRCSAACGRQSTAAGRTAIR